MQHPENGSPGARPRPKFPPRAQPAGICQGVSSLTKSYAGNHLARNRSTPDDKTCRSHFHQLAVEHQAGSWTRWIGGPVHDRQAAHRASVGQPESYRANTPVSNNSPISFQHITAAPIPPNPRTKVLPLQQPRVGVKIQRLKLVHADKELRQGRKIALPGGSESCRHYRSVAGRWLRVVLQIFVVPALVAATGHEREPSPGRRVPLNYKGHFDDSECPRRFKFRRAMPITKLGRNPAATLASASRRIHACTAPSVRLDAPELRHVRETMKRLFTICMFLACVSFCFAQGIRGNVKLSGNATVTTTGHSVALTWTASQNAASYNIYRGAVHGGPYTKVASGVVSTTYNDAQVTHGQTLYYVATAVNGSNESGYSNEISVVIP